MKVKSGLISGTEKRESISVKPENCIIKSPQKRESISVKPEDGIVKSSGKRGITSVKTEIGLVNGSKEREIISVKLSGSNKEKTSIKGFETRFKTIRFHKQWRGNKRQKTLPMTPLQRMQLYEEVIFAISETPTTFAEMIDENPAWGYYFLESTNVLSEEHAKHNLWESKGQQRMVNYMEKKIAATRETGTEEIASPAMSAADAMDHIMDSIDQLDKGMPQAQSLEWLLNDDIDEIMNDTEEPQITQEEIDNRLVQFLKEISDNATSNDIVLSNDLWEQSLNSAQENYLNGCGQPRDEEEAQQLKRTLAEMGGDRDDANKKRKQDDSEI